ncbi:hypothetical protein GON03_18715 [Nocardioides sp. MAH-18]|uniref:DUF6752 domain-containing protein n=1 Tax=Nocardioides agri TaxID=2682843 RepID=A0A6L6XVI9_9ACTN|nr:MULTISPECIES: DUF6752 domain-containing protein [unclassified Nocardioides]MBA2956377.1 hypothetical protein [Nocardioides sp. CGMCC 1.13656]MVQ51220.1 hypothetical protein [Nocardioides sp. MAH-18]
MTERVYLHVGTPKSGTTYLQRVLDHNREALAAAGVLVVGEQHVDRVHAALAVREDPRVRTLSPRQARSWERLVAQIRAWQGPAAVLSYELFSAATREQAERALADLAGLDVHVVITARDFGKMVPSAWQERLKFGLTTPLPQWRPARESAGPRREWGWRTMDPASVAERWGASLPADHVHVVTVPRTRRDPDELWHRFAAACDLTATTTNLDLGVGLVNESLGVTAAELLRRVNERIGPPIEGSREQAKWLRDTLAHRVLAPLDSEPIRITDRQLKDAERQAGASVERVGAAGYDVRGDLGDLEPSEGTGRSPEDVTDSELLDVALDTIAQLLLLVRERSQSAAPAEPGAEGGRLRRAAKTAAQRTSAPYLRHRAEANEKRIAELEKQVAADRALHLRVAALQDVVTELLLPIGDRDPEVTIRALRRYHQESV